MPIAFFCRTRAAWLLTLAGLATLIPASTAQAAPPVALRQVAQGLSLPVELVPANDGSGRMFVVEQGGRIKILSGGVVLPTAFLDISSGVISAGGERGLLGLAFHPQYASNGAFYVYYTRAADGALTISRYLRDPNNANLAQPASGAPILVVPHSTYANHNGGHLAFGPDGLLYIGTGDGGSGGDPDHNGQSVQSRLGKLLRIAVDGGTGYTIPPGNPYASGTCATACPEIWAFGLRNPWKFSFDRQNGDLFIGDVGQNTVEEVDLQPASATGGVNYGWGVFEGNNCYNDNYFGAAGACAALAGHTRPILTYLHDSNGGIAVTGGYRYRGTTSPALQGYYIYGDYSSRRLFAAKPDPNGVWIPEELLPPPASVNSISSFGQDEAGELYLVDYGNGKIWAIDGPPALDHVTSVKTHAAAGDQPLTIDHTAAIGSKLTTEPRLPGAGHQLVFSLSGTVRQIDAVTCENAFGTATGQPTYTISGKDVRVSLGTVPDRIRVKVTLKNVNGLGADVAASVAFLTGDINSTQTVTASDLAAIKARSPVPVGSNNFLADIDLSGTVDSQDLAAAKANAGKKVP
jgi:glucose/arabinose dehydrogenase